MTLPSPSPRRSLTRRAAVTCLATVSACVLAFAPLSARAATAAEARTFITTFGDKLIAIVDSNQSIDAKKAAVLPLLQQNVDIPLIGKFCLGRYWRTATPEQQKRYLELFDHVLVTAITDRIGDYRGTRLTVTGASPVSDGQLVKATLTRPGQPTAQLQILVEDANGSPKVADMMGEGASLRLTQRQEYASYLAHKGGDVQALIDALQRQNDRHH